MLLAFYDEMLDAYAIVDTEQYLLYDSDWINFFGISREEYTESLKQFGAVNNKGKGYLSRMLFKDKKKAQRAIQDFFEPNMILHKMLNDTGV